VGFEGAQPLHQSRHLLDEVVALLTALARPGAERRSALWVAEQRA
jgi:hypothetical protein